MKPGTSPPTGTWRRRTPISCCSSATTSTNPTPKATRAAHAVRRHANAEPKDLAGYRIRYAQYRTDPDLQALACRGTVSDDLGRPRGRERLRRPVVRASGDGSAGFPAPACRRVSGVLRAHAAAPPVAARWSGHAGLRPAAFRHAGGILRAGRTAVSRAEACATQTWAGWAIWSHAARAEGTKGLRASLPQSSPYDNSPTPGRIRLTSPRAVTVHVAELGGGGRQGGRCRGFGLAPSPDPLPQGEGENRDKA